MRWSEVDIHQWLWTIPPQRFKSRREHVIPMTKPLLALVSAIELSGECVFGHVLTGWSKARAQIDRLMVVEEIPRKRSGPPIRFGLHERAPHSTNANGRAANSGLGGGGVGHQTQTRLGLTYNRYDPIKEKREALSKWADYLAEIVK